MSVSAPMGRHVTAQIRPKNRKELDAIAWVRYRKGVNGYQTPKGTPQ